MYAFIFRGKSLKCHSPDSKVLQIYYNTFTLFMTQVCSLEPTYYVPDTEKEK